MALYQIKRGDAYSIPIELRLNGEAVSIDNIETVEVSLDRHVRRTYPGQLRYDEEDGVFYFPLTQSETLSLGEGLTLPLDVRVRFSGGNVLGTPRPALAVVTPSSSGQEL